MTDIDITTTEAWPQEWRDVDYVQINHAANIVSESGIVAYWMNSYGERTNHHDAKILYHIDKLTALAVPLRARIAAQ